MVKKKYFTEKERRRNKKYYQNHKDELKLKVKEYKQNNKEKINKKNKEYYENHKDEIKLKAKEYRKKNNKEKIKIYKAEYYRNNKEKITLRAKKYYQTHKKEINEYVNNKLKMDINYKLRCSLRTRLNMSIKNNQKSGSAVRDLGCSIPELKTYLESKFQEGMTWDNHGEWHIDHIKPLSSFNLQNREEFLKACHYSNLQPLWAEENLIKNKF